MESIVNVIAVAASTASLILGILTIVKNHIIKSRMKNRLIQKIL